MISYCFNSLILFTIALGDQMFQYSGLWFSTTIEYRPLVVSFHWLSSFLEINLYSDSSPSDRCENQFSAPKFSSDPWDFISERKMCELTNHEKELFKAEANTGHFRLLKRSSSSKRYSIAVYKSADSHRLKKEAVQKGEEKLDAYYITICV